MPGVENRFATFLVGRKEGKPFIILKNAEQTKEQLVTWLSRRDGDFEETVYAELKRITGGKSSRQLGYLWGEIYPKMALGYQSVGYKYFDIYDAHEEAKSMFFYKAILNDDTGEMKKVPRSLATATHEEMGSYIELLINFIETEFAIPVNQPNTYENE